MLRKLPACCLAECLGTFLLVLFGCGAVHVAVLTGDLTGLWQVAIVWGIAIMLAIYVFGPISGAHINPAITIGLAAWGLFPRDRAIPYIGSQFLGAFAAAAALFAMFHPWIAAKEEAKGIARGAAGSEITAMCYGEYYPNPGAFAAGEEPLDLAKLEAARDRMPLLTAFMVEFLGTAVLALVVLAVSEPKANPSPGKLAPVFIGLTVTALVCILAPLTQACFNPARDFGPRLFALLAGWGSVAFPGPNGIGVVVVYIVSPVVGSVAGMGLYRLVLHREVVPETVERSARPMPTPERIAT